MTKGGQPNNKIGIFLVGLAANDIFQKVFVADIDGIMWSDIQPAWEEKVVLSVLNFKNSKTLKNKIS